jgi:hypothetical protein
MCLEREASRESSASRREVLIVIEMVARSRRDALSESKKKFLRKGTFYQK